MGHVSVVWGKTHITAPLMHMNMFYSLNKQQQQQQQRSEEIKYY